MPLHGPSRSDCSRDCAFNAGCRITGGGARNTPVHIQRLLDAASLLRQVIALGLEVENPNLVAENYTQMALAALG